MNINLEHDENEKEIDGIIMMDRTTDLISPFCYQRSYEGRLDDNFNINTCIMSITNKIAIPDENKRKEEELNPDEKSDYIFNNNSYEPYKKIRNQYQNKGV